MIFDPKVIKSREYQSQYLLKEEEDKDSFGNKGFFKNRDDFRIGILVNGVEEDHLKIIEH